jgi:hypothetical protein
MEYTHILTPVEFMERKHKGEHFATSVIDSPKLFVKGTEHEIAALG